MLKMMINFFKEHNQVIFCPLIPQIIRPGADIRFKHSHDLIKIGLLKKQVVRI